MSLKPRQLILITLFLLLTSYSLYQARFLIFGPQLTILSHHDGEVILNNVVTIEGLAKNAAWLSFNDRQIFTDEKGRWSEKLILSEGPSIITVKARDRFGREVEEKLTLILE